MLEEVVRRVAALATGERTILVAIDGGAGAGKSTFAVELARGTSASVLRTDLFYRPVAERWSGGDMPVAYDLDWERLRDEAILPLRAGQTARFQLYDWVADRLNEWVVIEPGGVVIIDGVCSLRNELADLYDLRLWFSCPRELRIARMLSRGDTSQTEIDTWIPIEDRYHDAHRPDRSADLVIDGAATRTPRSPSS